MIIGIGTDMVEIERIQKACSKEGFLKRCFTDREKVIIEKRIKSAAGNFAVKEAVSKVLGTGFRDFKLTDVEVLRDELGKPYVILHNGAKHLADNLGIERIHVSITDTDKISMAFAIGDDGK